MMPDTTLPLSGISPTLSKEALLAAQQRIQPYVHRTPVLTCQNLNTWTGSQLFFKCENFQKMGAFKMRGASNAVLLLPEEKRRHGVATHSSGNFAQALSLAAKQQGLRAFIVMPSNATRVKMDAVKTYGGEIIECAPTLQAREETLREVVNRTRATVVHPFNDEHVILGQGTAALELMEDAGPLDYLIAPVGGGGLCAGTALAAHFFSPSTQVIGAEPAGADDAWQSMQAGRIVPQTNPQTIADGLRTSLGDKTFPVLYHLANHIIRVEEAAIVEAMRRIFERMKIVVEPSAAVALAAVLAEPDRFRDCRTGIILSGGNADLSSIGLGLLR